MRLILVLLVLLAATTGCSTAISTLQPAQTLPAGHFHGSAGLDVNVPASRIINAIDTGVDISKNYAEDPSRAPTAEEQRLILNAATGLALNAPGVQNDLMIRYGIVDRFDAGLRYSGTGLHLDGKFEFLRTKTDWSGSISAGYSYQLYSGLVFNVLDVLNVNDYHRHNIEIPVLLGKKFDDWGYFWCGPKYILSIYSLDASLKNVKLVNEVNGVIHYVGGMLGGAVGYKHAYLFGELTVMHVFARPEILGQPVDLGGLVAMPSMGIMLRI